MVKTPCGRKPGRRHAKVIKKLRVKRQARQAAERAARRVYFTKSVVAVPSFVAVERPVQKAVSLELVPNNAIMQRVCVSNPSLHESKTVNVVPLRSLPKKVDSLERLQRPDEETDRYLAGLFPHSSRNLSTTEVTAQPSSECWGRMRNLFSSDSVCARVSEQDPPSESWTRLRNLFSSDVVRTDTKTDPMELTTEGMQLFRSLFCPERVSSIERMDAEELQLFRKLFVQEKSSEADLTTEKMTVFRKLFTQNVSESASAVQVSEGTNTSKEAFSLFRWMFASNTDLSKVTPENVQFFRSILAEGLANVTTVGGGSANSFSEASEVSDATDTSTEAFTLFRRMFSSKEQPASSSDNLTTENMQLFRRLFAQGLSESSSAAQISDASDTSIEAFTLFRKMFLPRATASAENLTTENMQLFRKLFAQDPKESPSAAQLSEGTDSTTEAYHVFRKMFVDTCASSDNLDSTTSTTTDFFRRLFALPERNPSLVGNLTEVDSTTEPLHFFRSLLAAPVPKTADAATQTSAPLVETDTSTDEYDAVYGHDVLPVCGPVLPVYGPFWPKAP